MRYIKILFTKGLTCEAFQEVDISGNVTRYINMEGEELVLPEVTESEVVSDSEEASAEGAEVAGEVAEPVVEAPSEEVSE